MENYLDSPFSPEYVAPTSGAKLVNKRDKEGLQSSIESAEGRVPGLMESITGQDVVGYQNAQQLFGDRASSDERIREGYQKPADVPKFDEAKYALSNHAKMAGGVLAVIGIIGAAKMRTGALGAMKALTATMVGLHTGHEAMYQKGVEDYKTHLAQVIEENKRILAENHALIADEKMTMQEKIDQFNLLQLSSDIRRKEKIKTLDEVYKEIAKDKASLDKLVEIDAKPLPQPRTPAKSAEIQWIDKYRKDHPKATADEAQEAYGTAHPKGGKKGGRSFTPAGGTKTPQQWVDEVRKEHADWTPEQVAAEAKKRAGVK